MSQAPVATGTSSSSLTDLTLQVRQDNAPEQEVFLQHGLSIGRNPSNTICIEHPDVERIHAQVMRQPDGTMLLECISEQPSLTLADGSKVQSIKLHPGSTFKLGAATIRCLKRETKPTVVVAENPWQVRCPRCHEVIVTLPHDATHCPRCNLEIQYVKPPPAAPGSEPSPTDTFEGWLPKQVGPYRIRAFVAQGGMGIVLRGLHEQTDALAAVKLLKIDPANDPTWRARFLAEIDTLQSLKHPNVVRLQAHGQDEKMLWLAMDWIDGTPLSKWAAKIRATGQQVPLDQIAQVMDQVVSGLIYLHRKGIIHRDLKPSNILLAQDDSVKMVDFGIARQSSGQTGVVTHLTQTGMVAGTESYMSPEQGEGKPLTGASDIYSLAIIWYELITGRRPVGAYVPPNIVRPDCPPTWAAVIAACLSAEPRMRPALESILASLGGSAVPPPLQGAAAGGATPPLIPGAAGTGVLSATGLHPTGMHPTGMHATGMHATGMHATGIHAGAVVPPPPPPPGGAGMTGITGMTPGHVAGAYAGGTLPPPPPPPRTGNAVANVTAVVGRGVGVASDLIKKIPADKALDKMGPVGTWIRAHRKESIAIGVVLFLLLVIIIVRVSSDDAPPAVATGGGGGGGGAAAAVQPNQGGGGGGANANANRNRNQPAPVVPQVNAAADAQKLYDEGYELMIRADREGDIEMMQRGANLMNRAANAGNREAMWMMAQYHFAPGPQHDIDKVREWLRKGAAAGDPKARVALQQLERMGG